MATKEAVNTAITTGAAGALAPLEGDRLETMLESPAIKRRFAEVLGSKAPAFVSSVIAATKANQQLKLCPPMSVISSAMIAATLDLPINPSLGFAHIVPYRENGQLVAQFQLGWRGFVQLGIRSGGYKTMNASELYADEIESWNPITGDLRFTPMDAWKDRYEGKAKPVGYCAFIRMVNGFEKFLYMTREQVDAHAKKFSKTYQQNKGQWVRNFDAMALKTVIKLLLSKFGMLSIDYQMQKAIQADQATFDAKGEIVNYPDSTIGEEMIGDAQEPAEENQ